MLIYYLNFKYGYSQAPELGDTVEREVRDRDYFYLWSFSAWSVWAALGLVFVWESVAALIGTEAVRIGKAVLRDAEPSQLDPVLAAARPGVHPAVRQLGTRRRARRHDHR